MKRDLPLSLLLLSVLFALPAFGGTTGKVAGRVTESDGRSPIVGANVLLQNTMLGAATDGDGYFSIINVPPGVYTARIAMMGYRTVHHTKLAVSVDRTTRLDVQLQAATVDMEAVEVVAQRPMIIRDLTSTVQKVASAQIEKLPFENVNEILRLQAGVTRDEGGTLHMRGGRDAELTYYVNGMSITNPFAGGMAIPVQNSSIQEIEVISGAFNAEYGQAMSGILNIITKEGGEVPTATFSAEMGDFASGHESMFPHINNMSPLAQQYYDGSLSGPLPVPGVSGHYFLSGRYRKEENWLYGQRRYVPTDTTNFMGTDPGRWSVTQSGDNAYVPLNNAEAVSLQGNISLQLMSNLKLSYMGLWDDTKFRNYNLDNSRSSSHRNVYNPDYLRTNTRRGLNNLVTVTHTISPSVYHELRLTYYWTDSQVKSRDNPFDPIFNVAIHENASIPDNIFYVGDLDPNFLFRRGRTMAAKYELSTQFDRHNLVKLGAEVRKHRLEEDYFRVLRNSETNWQLQITGTNASSHNYYDRKPLEIAAYVQDKIEIEDFIVNAGVRFDYFDPHAPYLIDTTDPGNQRGLPFESVFAYAPAKMQVSPRLGLAFPISDNGNIHASYGQFFQIPEFARLYENPEFEVTGHFQTYIGNANLEAQRTTVYEIGLQQRIASNLVLDATCYYRDCRNLAGTHLYRTFDQVEYGEYANADYGHVWGITFTLDVLKTGLFSANVNYTYQVADGNGSDPRQAYLDAYNRNEAAKWLVPLNWDQRHVLNAFVSIDGDGWGISSISNFTSGLPYTPVTTYLPVANVQLTNQGRWAPEFNLDLQVYKSLAFLGIGATLFASVENVFDRMRDERLPQISDRDLATHAPLARFNSLYDYRNDPGFQPRPRLVKAGIRVKM